MMTVNSTEPLVILQIDAGVATITLNRPDRLNAINPAMDYEMHQAFKTACADPSARVIVFTGAGRGFCSGAERGAPNDGTPPPCWKPVPADLDEFRFNFLLNSPLPTIAAINGPAVGIGLVMACYCDIRLGMTSAKLSFLYPRLGLVAEYGIAKQLTDLIGLSRAQELLLSGRQFTAEQALAIGLVHQTFEAESFQTQVHEYALAMAKECSLTAHRKIKEQLRAASSQSLLECIQLAGQELIKIRETADYQEALAARQQKRSPVFTGR